MKAEVLVVDDHPLILEGICRVIDAMDEARVADAVSSGMKAVELASQRDYDLYIVDISLPDLTGFDMLQQIRQFNPDARIIVNTMHEEPWTINRIVQLGVNGVTLKSSDSAELANAVRSVLQGQSYACPRFAAVRQRLKHDVAACFPHDVPTRRERDVLQGIADGLSTRQIALSMDISENTVETFRKRLIAKFGARNAVDMVMKAVARGWVALPSATAEGACHGKP